MWRTALAVALPSIWAACSFDTGGLSPGDLAGLRPDSGFDRSRSDGGQDGGVDLRSDLAAVDGRPDLRPPDVVRPPDLACATGTTRPCYSGPPTTQGKGLCKAGSELCTAGSWSGCQGEVLPKQELCDGDDNNCDGLTDEGLTQACPYGGPAGTQNVGTCKAGSQTCSNGTYSACAGEVKPVGESCDKQDNDCDGAIDEGFGFKCESLACTGSGKIKTIGNLCVDSDGGSSGSSDELEVYCCDGIARFCLSKEACPWRAGCGTNAGATTCSRAGLSSDFMAHVSCQAWNGHDDYYCTAAGQVYFTP